MATNMKNNCPDLVHGQSAASPLLYQAVAKPGQTITRTALRYVHPSFGSDFQWWNMPGGKSLDGFDAGYGLLAAFDI